MDIPRQKTNTKRPAIVQVATSLFATRGIDGWPRQQGQQIIGGAGGRKVILRSIIWQEFTVAKRYPEVFLYFHTNEKMRRENSNCLPEVEH